MMHNRVVILAIFLLIGLYGSSCLIFIGTINGKSFFVETNRTTWAAAKSRCQEGGMHLATINSEAERSLVINANESSAVGIGWHWTGARDAQSVTQFSWDHNNGTINSLVMTPLRHLNGIQTCVTMHIGRLSGYGFDAENCTLPYRSICELDHGKS